LLAELGNVMQVTDHLTYAELKAKIARRKSPKIWVIDSLQDALLTSEQCAELKRLFVLSKKKKIIIYVSWAEGKTPQGTVAKAVEYRANVKLRVEGYIIFPKSRYGGNMPFVIWEGDKTTGARGYWGDDFSRISKGLAAAKKADKKKGKKADKNQDKKEPVTKMQVLPGAPKPVFKEPLNDAI
jgi:hypothetical protein